MPKQYAHVAVAALFPEQYELDKLNNLQEGWELRTTHVSRATSGESFVIYVFERDKPTDS